MLCGDAAQVYFGVTLCPLLLGPLIATRPAAFTASPSVPGAAVSLRYTLASSGAPPVLLEVSHWWLLFKRSNKTGNRDGVVHYPSEVTTPVDKSENEMARLQGRHRNRYDNKEMINTQ